MKSTKSISTQINHDKVFTVLHDYLEHNSFSKLFILVDENTKKHCFPILREVVMHSFTLVEIKSGEQYKNLETSQFIWQELTKKGADRQSLLINLGGGVITDMGGFVAATFKRGMRFINIPTTLLAMVDAAIGGKTGVDFKHLKNQIGLFSHAEKILIFPKFLKTLDNRELRSGLAEVIKYGLIADNTIWDYIVKLNKVSLSIDDTIIKTSASIKEQIVAQDPTEMNIRKTLNFGHTLGHAIETHFMSKPKKEQLLHGEAVAIGMVLAAHLSYQTRNLAKEIVDVIAKNTLKFYDNLPHQFLEADLNSILDLLKHDKKNSQGNVNFILLKSIGELVIDCQVTDNEIKKSFDYYETYWRE